MFDYYVELLWQANGVRVVALCQGIVQNLNDLNFLCFAVLFRAFFEQVLLVRGYYYTKLLPKVKTPTPQGQVQSTDLIDLISELDTSVRRSKVDWEKIFAGSFNSVAQKGAVSDGVSLWASAKQWGANANLGSLTPEALYDVLCDLAHPNLGSALICMKQGRFGFAKAQQPSIGPKIFALLYPSLAAVAKEFQNLQDGILLLKFKQEPSNGREHLQ